MSECSAASAGRPRVSLAPAACCGLLDGGRPGGLTARSYSEVIGRDAVACRKELPITLLTLALGCGRSGLDVLGVRAPSSDDDAPSSSGSGSSSGGEGTSAESGSSSGGSNNSGSSGSTGGTVDARSDVESRSVCLGDPCTTAGDCCRGQACFWGSCACTLGLTACGNDCFDTQNDALHCGSCAACAFAANS